MSENSVERSELLELTADIVAAYAGKNPLPSTDLPPLIETIFRTLSQVGSAPAEPEIQQKPAVSVKKSITDKAVVCLECGRGQKTLKRHLAAAHGLTPEEYRAKWRLSPDYPMVAPDYAEKRRQLAKEIGLGRTGTAKPKSGNKSGSKSAAKSAANAPTKTAPKSAAKSAPKSPRKAKS